MSLRGVGPQVALSIGTLVALILIFIAVLLYKRRKLGRAQKRREAEGDNLSLNDVESGRRPGGLQWNPPALPFSAQNGPQDPALQAQPPTYPPASHK